MSVFQKILILFRISDKLDINIEYEGMYFWHILKLITQ